MRVRIFCLSFLFCPRSVRNLYGYLAFKVSQWSIKVSPHNRNRVFLRMKVETRDFPETCSKITKNSLIFCSHIHSVDTSIQERQVPHELSLGSRSFPVENIEKHSHFHHRSKINPPRNWKPSPSFSPGQKTYNYYLRSRFCLRIFSRTA